MYKIATIGFLVAALVGPASAAAASAAGKRAPVRPSAQSLCAVTVSISPARGYGLCGGRFWLRDPETGKVSAVPFWRLQHMDKEPDDHP